MCKVFFAANTFWLNYRTISLISHPSKIMLLVILNRLEAKAEELLAEDQAVLLDVRAWHAAAVQSSWTVSEGIVMNLSRSQI